MWWFLCKGRHKRWHFPKTSITVASISPKTAFGLGKLLLMVQVFVESIHHIHSQVIHINSPASLAVTFSSKWQCKVNTISNRCAGFPWIRKTIKKLTLAGEGKIGFQPLNAYGVDFWNTFEAGSTYMSPSVSRGSLPMPKQWLTSTTDAYEADYFCNVRQWWALLQ